MRAALPILLLALTIYALLDCARTPEELMPARMPKLVWIFLIVVAIGIGPIAWIIVSRVKAAEERGGVVEPTVWSSKEGTQFRRPERPRPVAPDDDPEFLRSLERDIRRKRRREDRDGDDVGNADAGDAGAGGAEGTGSAADSPEDGA
ncbi:hypothetical protein AM609_10640 [Actinomyces sp. oral taxon 414]|uniref:PLD nuclease N-terminal domain-containing protein n=1 Tax=Actinomyces sp. oral taxon 414 TaxID=712122 RepID=UPI0006AFBEA7|nr:PLD nuclease N-terminal domain-containing protein [Actinomyces sp. oral taxon 414]ALC99811.1 hypothetical protein AM609_10640 [Actinomyces sp. oral taxon 414]